MKVLVLTTSYLPKLNGVTRTVSTLSDGLARRGNDVTVATRWRKGLLRESKETSIRVIRLGRGRGRGESLLLLGAMTLFVVRSLRKREFEIVHAHGTIPGLSAVLGKLIGNAPFVVSFHQDALIGWETGHNRLGGFKQHVAKLLQMIVCKFSAAVTVQSPEVMSLTRQVLGLDGKTRMVVLPNAVDIMRFSVDSSPPPSNQKILFVGNLIRRKGIDVLIRSVAILVSSFPLVRLTIVGKGPEKGILLDLARELGVSQSISFVDEIDDRKLASLYRDSAVVVLPSDSEVFGVVILEALAANRPVVATATVGALSIITDGVSGRIVPIGSTEMVAGAIASVFTDYRSAVEMARVGHQLAVSRYSSEAIAERLDSLYRSVICSRGLDSRTSPPETISELGTAQ